MQGQENTLNMQSSSLGRNIRNDDFVCHSVCFISSKPNKTSWHYTVAGAQRGGQGGIIPRAPNHYGGRRMTVGAPKIPNNVTSTFFSTVGLLPKDFKFEPGGAKLTPLYGRVSCTCGKVWVSSPHWRSLLRMWLSKLLQLSPRSAASIWWEKLLYSLVPKPFQKLVQIHTSVFI